MSATNIKRNKLPEILAPFGGGYYLGLLNFEDELRALIMAPKAEGQTRGIYGNYGSDKDKLAISFYDGLTNTKAMAKAGSVVAQWALGLRIGGHKDWCVPARDQLEICYRVCKPTSDTNWVNRNGDNPSSVPPGYPYTEKSPKQVTSKLFRAGGKEAFESEWYLTSTRCSAHYAWMQYFGSGHQGWYYKSLERWVRAVRTVPVSN